MVEGTARFALSKMRGENPRISLILIFKEKTATGMVDCNDGDVKIRSLVDLDEKAVSLRLTGVKVSEELIQALEKAELIDDEEMITIGK